MWVLSCQNTSYSCFWAETLCLLHFKRMNVYRQIYASLIIPIIYWYRTSPSQIFPGQLENFQSVWKLWRLHGIIKAVCEMWNFKLKLEQVPQIESCRPKEMWKFWAFFSEGRLPIRRVTSCPVLLKIWPKTCMKGKILFFNKVIHRNRNTILCRKPLYLSLLTNYATRKVFVFSAPLYPVKFGSC